MVDSLLIGFFAAIFLLIITPGPGVLSTAGVGSAFGFRSGLRYVTGLFIGNNLVGILVVSGLATVIIASPWARNFLLFLSTGYLLYLAARIAFAGSRIGFIRADKKPGLLAGITLQLINPKAYVVNTTLFSGFGFYPESLLIETLIKFLAFNLVWVPVHLLWLWLGVKLQSMNLAPAIQFRVNLSMALAMVVVVLLAFFSSPLAQDMLSRV